MAIQGVEKSTTSTTATDPVRVDSFQTPFNVNVELIRVGTSATIDLQYTTDKPDMTNASDNWANATWRTDTTLTGITDAYTNGLVDVPCTAVRAKPSAISSATVTIKVSQGNSQ